MDRLSENQSFQNDLIRPVITSLVFTIGILLFSLYFPSMLNNLTGVEPEYGTLQFNEGYLQKVVDYHQENITFARRPLTTWMIQACDQITGMGIGLCFILVNFFLFFLSGISLYRLARTWGASPLGAWLSQGSYFLAFSVLFAFFKPIYTYDEPLQYTCLFIALRFLSNRKWWGFWLYFLLALAARETSFMLYPALIWWLWQQHHRQWKQFAPEVFKLLIPLLIYIPLILIYINSLELAESTQKLVAEERFKVFEFNFSSRAFILETIWAMVLTLAPLFLTIAAHRALVRAPSKWRSREAGILLVVVLNIALVLVAARAREARLFALPMILFWPVMGAYWLDILGSIRNNWHAIKKWIWVIPVLLITEFWPARLVVSYFFAMTNGSFPEGPKLYLFLTLMTGCLTLALIIIGLLNRFKNIDK